MLRVDSCYIVMDMIRRPARSTQRKSAATSDLYEGQINYNPNPRSKFYLGLHKVFLH